MFLHKPRLIFYISLVFLVSAVPIMTRAAMPNTGQWSGGQDPVLAARNALANTYLPLVQRSMCGKITANTTWTVHDSPIQVTCDVIVSRGVTLTIEAGVTVQFAHMKDDLIISGTLQTAGTESAPITFQPSINTMPGSWGRVAFMAGSSGMLDNAILEYGGSSSGLVYIASDAVQVLDSVVQYCSNTGIYIHDSSPVISGTQVISNSNGLFNDTGSPIIQNCTFSGNSGGDGGGGLYNGSGSPTIQNNLIINNHVSGWGSTGGGLYNGSGNPFVLNNTIYGNHAERECARQYCSGSFGGGLYNNNGSPFIHNNIFINNEALGGSGIWSNTTAPLNLDYNDVWSNDTYGVNPGTHEISVNPRLVDPANGDFHLAPDSPCIDSGDPDQHSKTDIDKEPRPMGVAPDIGADEFRSLSVRKSSQPEETSPGGTITYTMTIVNPEPFILTAVQLTDTLPGETTFTGYQAEGLTCTHDGSTWGGQLRCELDGASLAPGESQVLALTVRVTDTLLSPMYVMNSLSVTARDGGAVFLASDRVRTWISECAVRLNDTPMGRDFKGAIADSTQPSDVVKVSGYCHVHDLRLDKILLLQGGWSKDFSQWNPMMYTTTLDGQSLGRVIEVVGFVNPTIEGFVITGGNSEQGSGLYIDSGNPKVQNNIFSGNVAHSFGGGLYNGSGSPIIQGNTFYTNTASYAGGMYNGPGNPTIRNNIFSGNSNIGLLNINGNPTIQNNTFTGNIGLGLSNNHGSPLIQNNIFSANSDGGLENAYGSPIIQNNTFSGNSAVSGGGLDTWGSWGDPIIQNNIFFGNSAIFGGGLYNSSYEISRPVIQNNTFYSNTADYGGGLASYTGNPIIQNNTFTGNSANNGGGLEIYREDPVVQNSNPLIQNNIFTGNLADKGGGMETLDGSPNIQNNTFTGNSAGIGGGIHIGLSSSPTIRSNILVSNTAGASGGGIYNDSTGELITLSYNDIWNNTKGDYIGISPGPHDISVDPLLFNPANGDFHLSAGSPCIDAGDPANYPTTDFEGDPRPQGLAPDIGADEYIGKSEAFSRRTSWFLYIWQPMLRPYIRTWIFQSLVYSVNL